MSLVVFEGVPGSDALLRGDYELGLRQSLDAYDGGPGRHAVELTNNLCVAHAKLGDLAAASEHCERAMEARIRGGNGMLESQHYRAVVLVNRGVLHSVQGEMAAAGADFAEAGRGFPQLGVARSNLLRLGEAGEPPTTTQ